MANIDVSHLVHADIEAIREILEDQRESISRTSSGTQAIRDFFNLVASVLDSVAVIARAAGASVISWAELSPEQAQQRAEELRELARTL